MEKFCEDIGVEPENVVMLVLAYKMGARRMGFFTQPEWTKGLTDLQCDTPSKVQSKLDHLRNYLNDFTTFKGVYRYAYDFARVRFNEHFLETNEYYQEFPSYRIGTNVVWTSKRLKQCCSYC